MTPSDQSNTLPPRARRRSLSREAYLNDLAASRRWKREHPDEAASHNWKVCSCGQPMSHHSAECKDCRDEREARRVGARRARIVQMWAAGLLLREIAAELGWTLNHVRAEFGRMRDLGYDLPLRPPGGIR